MFHVIRNCFTRCRSASHGSAGFVLNFLANPAFAGLDRARITFDPSPK